MFFSPASVKSLLHASFNIRFRRPLLVPGMSTSSILLTMCSSSILLTWPYHFSRFSVIFVDVCTTLVVSLMRSFRIVSLLVTPHIHLSNLVSFTSSRALEAFWTNMRIYTDCLRFVFNEKHMSSRCFPCLCRAGLTTVL